MSYLYIYYDILVKTCCCKKEVKVASMDYHHNAIERRNTLVETFGRDNVRIERKMKEIVDKKEK